MSHSVPSVTGSSAMAAGDLVTSPPDYPAIGLVIDGRWEHAGSRRTAPVVNPSTGKVLGDLLLAEAGDVAHALDAAASSFDSWAATAAVERSGVLRRTADFVRRRAETLVALIGSFASDEAISEANRLSVGLTSYVFSHDLRVVERLSAAIRSGGVIVNDWAASYPETPFGGMGDSGIGAEGGVEGLQAFQQVKFVSRRA